jgi:CRP-like cAMP-binding protein
VILLTDIPEREKYVDQVVTTQIQFLRDIDDEKIFGECLSRALTRVALDTNKSYKLRFLAPQEILFKESEPASSVYFVKRGGLRAIKDYGGQNIILGPVQAGEFVGEMAHFNGQPRSATVQAVSDCEMIEIPTGVLDMVLFSKPAWAKALIGTLAKRLMRSNTPTANSTLKS